MYIHYTYCTQTLGLQVYSQHFNQWLSVFFLCFEIWVILVICIILLFWIKGEIKYRVLFNKNILGTVPVQFRFFQKAGAERVCLEINQTKAEDLPS